jgi:proteic killer suppression protein
MIKTFRCKYTEKVFLREPVYKFSQDICRKALRKLLLIDAADRLGDLREPPGNQLEKLSGSRQGQYSIRVNEQWRICFIWEDGDAFEIEIVDYH